MNFVSYSVYRVLIEATCNKSYLTALSRGQLFSANENLDSTPGIALPIFALAKVAKIIYWTRGIIFVPGVQYIIFAATM